MTARHSLAGLLATAGASAVLVGPSQPAHAAQAGSQGAQSSNVETVVVNGTRNQAAEIKKNAPVVIDIAPLEQIRSLPDVNAAEVLQRLPGVSMESNSAPGASSTSAAWTPTSTARPMTACA